MKKIYLVLAAIVAILNTVTAQNKEDISSIKSLCGCYEVAFKYAETFPTDSNYKIVKPYITGGTEWIELIEEQSGKLSLQHLLQVSDTMIIKHWREDWTYQNTEVLNYVHSEQWKKVTLPSSAVKGQWTQSVWGVTDEPRYQGTATWVHVDGKHYWYNTTDAPLPRREYSKRKDYNVLNRTNIIWANTKQGWLHEQENKKVLRVDGKADSILVQEKGYNYYNKIDDKKCAGAKKWWVDNKKSWISVRKDWDDKIKKSTDISL